jgi:hypothetical protein
MRRNPDERYQNAADLLADLDRYQELTAADFVFPDEQEERVPNAESRLILLGAAIAGGFVLVVALAIGIVVLAQHA